LGCFLFFILFSLASKCALHSNQLGIFGEAMGWL